jgi:hypothetical protein
LVKLAMIHRVELGPPQAFERPRTREEVLHKMEERAGLAGRRMLEKSWFGEARRSASVDRR